MPYPLISEYIEAIKATEDNFEKLTNLRPVLTDDGQPVMTSGNFAVVFKMEDVESGKFYALKCFTKEQEGREEAYHQIAEELKDVDSPYLISIQYLNKELFVDTDQTSETEFPVLLMDWVEGKTLDKYLRENLDDKYTLEMLAYRFSQLAQWLIPQPFAHGDLKPDNILVREDGTLVLVDYDGMYVPVMKGQKARELGSPDYRHPQRTEDDFDEHIDDFSLISMLLSLTAISINPLLLEEFGASDRLLFSEFDYINTESSKLIMTLLHMSVVNELKQVFSLFLLEHSFYGNKLVASIIDSLVLFKEISNNCIITKVNKKEFSDCFVDEEGNRYSRDGKRLLEGRQLARWHYNILPGTEIICDDAFAGGGDCWNEGEYITIPESVKMIGRNPFAQCIANIVCKSKYYIVHDSILYTNDMKHLVSFIGYKSHVLIPEGVTHIDDRAFYGQVFIKTIKFPHSLESIGNKSFYKCGLQHICFYENLQNIGKEAFSDCYDLEDVRLPNSLLHIGNLAFANCPIIKTQIPNSVISIGINPFYGYGFDKRRITVDRRSMLYEDDGKAIYTTGKKYLISFFSDDTEFNLPDTVTHIASMAFKSCYLQTIRLSSNVQYIGNDAFIGCTYYGEWSNQRTKIVTPKNIMHLVRNQNLFWSTTIEECN
ncbi:MAG: leucine-rich repeat protein [Paludibacteraceae bacterium]|nr:leucine-rich repeat protein [Paludibacteraceae bacterium]